MPTRKASSRVVAGTSATRSGAHRPDQSGRHLGAAAQSSLSHPRDGVGARTFDARERRFGGLLEDYEIGDVYRHWPGMTITEADNHLFCLLTMASHPLHMDSHFMASAQGLFDRPVVVGSYVYSLLLGMSVPDMSGRALANLGTTDLRHVAPVYPGDTLYGVSTVLEVRASASRAGTGVLTFETAGSNQHGAVVATFTRSVLLPQRAAP